MEKTDLRGADISGTNFENSRISQTIIDMDGFIKFGQLKGFVLEE